MTNESTRGALRRSRRNRVVAGVCGGLGEFFGISPFWFRLGFLLALIPGGIPGLVPYLVLWLVIPRAN
jgi:phage shock protein C